MSVVEGGHVPTGTVGAEPTVKDPERRAKYNIFSRLLYWYEYCFPTVWGFTERERERERGKERRGGNVLDNFFYSHIAGLSHYFLLVYDAVWNTQTCMPRLQNLILNTCRTNSTGLNNSIVAIAIS